MTSPARPRAPTPPPRLRVLVVSADPLTLGGLIALVDGAPGLRVAAGAAPSDDLREAAARHRPDAVACDVGPGDGVALEALRDLDDAGVPGVALLASDDQAADALAAGARGLLRRGTDAIVIAAALRAAAAGLVVLDSAVAGPLLRERAVPAAPPSDPLTTRETEVLHLLAAGLTNRAIADRLHISEHTAKFHVNAILAKLGARSRTEAVVRAARLGLAVL